MNFSGYDDEPSSRFLGAASFRPTSSIRLRSDVIASGCSSRAHAVYSHRAMLPRVVLEPSSGPPHSALTGPPVRHANCSNYCSTRYSAFENDAFEIQSEGFGAENLKPPPEVKPAPSKRRRRTGSHAHDGNVVAGPWDTAS